MTEETNPAQNAAKTPSETLAMAQQSLEAALGRELIIKKRVTQLETEATVSKTQHAEVVAALNAKIEPLKIKIADLEAALALKNNPVGPNSGYEPRIPMRMSRRQ